jgi:hypothetical protein
MAETQAAQLARLDEKLAQVQREKDQHEARIAALEAHDAEYKRIIGLSRWSAILLLGAGSVVAWLPGWIIEIRRLLTGR